MAEFSMARAATRRQGAVAPPGQETETILPRHGDPDPRHEATCADCGTRFLARKSVTRCRPCLLKHVGLPAHYRVWRELTPEERRRFDALWQQEANRPRRGGAYEGLVVREPRRRHE